MSSQDDVRVNVSAAQVRSCKNPNGKMISWHPDPRSNQSNKFYLANDRINPVGEPGDVAKKYELRLSKQGSYDVSHEQQGADGKTEYVHQPMTGSDIARSIVSAQNAYMRMREAGQLSSDKGRSKADAGNAAPVRKMYINGVDAANISSYDGVSTVSVMGGSVKFNVPDSAVRPGRGSAANDRRNIYLGESDLTVKYESVKDGRTVRCETTVAELVNMYNAYGRENGRARDIPDVSNIEANAASAEAVHADIEGDDEVYY